MLSKLLNHTVYVKVSKNKFTVKHIETDNEVSMNSTAPFTTERLLVGNFFVAELLLKETIEKVYKPRWYFRTPVIVMQPTTMHEGGLSEVEERILMELAAGAGARKVVVWVGNELTNEKVLEKAYNKQAN